MPVTADRSVRARRGVAAVAAVGGLLAIGSSFLPWISTATEDGGSTSITGWGGITGSSGILEPVVVQRQAGVLAHPDRPGAHRSGDVVDRARLGLLGRGVHQHELPAGVRRHLAADRHGHRFAAIVGVHRDRAVPGDHGGVDARVRRR